MRSLPKSPCLKCRGDAHPGFHDNSLFSQNDAATLVAVEHTTGVSQADSERGTQPQHMPYPRDSSTPIHISSDQDVKGQSSGAFRRQSRRYQDNEGP